MDAVLTAVGIAVCIAVLAAAMGALIKSIATPEEEE